jgi:hypothetical protein
LLHNFNAQNEIADICYHRNYNLMKMYFSIFPIKLLKMAGKDSYTYRFIEKVLIKKECSCTQSTVSHFHALKKLLYIFFVNRNVNLLYFFAEKWNNQRKYFWKDKILITYDVNFTRLKMQHLLYIFGFTAFILSRKIQMFSSQKHRTLSEKVNILCAGNYLI